MLSLLTEMQWFDSTFAHFTAVDRMELMRSFKLKRLSPGQRVAPYHLDYIDSFNLILKGKIGVFYPDL